jgi:Cytochrome c5
MRGAITLAIATFALASMAQAQDEYPEFDDPTLRLGRSVWVETCLACHTSDFAGAPQVTDAAAWAPRIAKGKDTLYQHALEGFHGPDGTEMPPRGGNSSLADEQVKAAVDYMVALVETLSGEKE